MKEIFIFLDWSMTISELIDKEQINKAKFDDFFKSLIKLEKKFSSKVRLCVVSGTCYDKAIDIHDILCKAFADKNREDIFKGLSYEYGSYFIEADTKNIVFISDCGLNKKDREKILKIANKYNIQHEDGYYNYLNFNGKDIDLEKFSAFAQECKDTLTKLSIIFYNDKEGVGLDIKNPLLNKGIFLKWFLLNKKPNIIIIGGDDEEDIKMISDFSNAQIYFIGFTDKNYTQTDAKIYLSKRKNIAGIIDCLNKLS